MALGVKKPDRTGLPNTKTRAILAGALQGRFCPFRVEACNSERYGNLNSAVPVCLRQTPCVF